VLHKATLVDIPNINGKVLCRMVTFDRLTSYLLEEYFTEIGRLKKIKMRDFVVAPIGYSTKENTLLVFQEEYLSLYDLLYNAERDELRRTMLDHKEKYSIVL
jgi:hypothetical protein